MSDAPTQSLDDVANFALRVGRLLLTAGSDTSRVVARIEALSRSQGVTAEAFVSSERLLLTVHEGEAYRTRIGYSLGGLGVDMGRVGAIDEIVDGLAEGEMDLSEARRRIDAVESAAPPYPEWLAPLALALTTACLATLFGATWLAAGAAFVAGGFNILLRRFLARKGANPIAAAFVTAVLSGVIGLALLRLAPNVPGAPCLIATGMILVPGIPLINGFRDLTSGHPGIGVSRLATSAVTITAIGLGLFVAAALAGAALPVFNGPPLLPLPHDLLLSALAATGFAVLFGAPRRAVWVCILCGMAGHGLRTGLQTTGIDIASATLIAAAVVGAVAVQAGRRLHLPWTTFAFPGVVAMIPGSYGFRAAAAGLEVMNHGPDTPAAYVADTLSLTISTVVLTAAIGTGLLFASALSQLDARPRRKKPQERAVPSVH